MRWLTTLWFIVALLIGFAPGSATAADETFAFEIGPPLATGKLTVEITLVIGTKVVKKKVEIPVDPPGTLEKDKKGIVATVMPIRLQKDPANANMKEKLEDFAQRVLNVQGEASRAKADVIRDAINAAFKDDFAKLPANQREAAKASTGFTTVKFPIFFVQEPGQIRSPPIRGLEAPFGELTIPHVLTTRQLDAKGKPDPKGKLIPTMTITSAASLGEFGDTAKIRKKVEEKPSPGFRGSLQPAEPGVSTVATGVDPLGNPSEVGFGVEGLFVANYQPSTGTPIEQILSILATLLDLGGLSATYDQDTRELFLDMPVFDGQALVWGSTDTGLEFQTLIAGLAVPEPASVTLVLLALLALLATTGAGPRAGRQRAKARPTLLAQGPILTRPRWVSQ